MQKLILEQYIIKLIRAFVIQQVRANKESELSLPVLAALNCHLQFLPTSSSPCPSVWEIVWLSSSYRAQWTPIVPASVELWRVMMMPLPVSDYPESNSNLIDPTNIATGGLILVQMDELMLYLPEWSKLNAKSSLPFQSSIFFGTKCPHC